MRLSFALATILLVSASSLEASKAPIFTPTRVSYNQLVKDGSSDGGDSSTNADPLIWTALQDVGMISITDVPSLNKQTTMKLLGECIGHSDPSSSSSSSSLSTTAPLHVFSDGTRRRTFATRTLAGDPEPLISSLEGETVDDACIALAENSNTFRKAVQTVSDALSGVLARWVDQTGTVGFDETDYLSVLKDSTGRLYSVEQTIKEGEHLEHFHCYYGRVDGEDVTANDGVVGQPTIDWHTDQGMLLIFSPGQIDGRTTDGLYVQLKDGSAVEVHFDADHDDLVVMLGDGVDQYVNPAVVAAGTASHISITPLRPVPHALRMPRLEGGTDGEKSYPPRVWYGRMVLPPPKALYPKTTSTFEEIRTSIIGQDPTALLLGCSGHHSRVLDEAPEVVSCNVTSQSYCWHKCMNFSDFDVSTDSCAEQGLDLACVNQEGYLWTGRHDPNFGLDCVNLTTAENVTYDDCDHDTEDCDHDHDDEATNGSDTSSSSIVGLSSVIATIGTLGALLLS